MSVEELIAWNEQSILQGEELGYNVEPIRQVNKLLKAGQAMRDATTDWDANTAYAAWDAATKEEDV